MESGIKFYTIFKLMMEILGYKDSQQIEDDYLPRILIRSELENILKESGFEHSVRENTVFN